MEKIFVVIATSLRRTSLLINKSLKSVYSQKKINPYIINVIIVDDNRNKEEFIKVKREVSKLRRKFRLKNNQFRTYVIKNKKTRFNSGTGAWNTAIDFIYKKNKNSYIAFLDDDDWFNELYLYHLKNSIKKNNVIAIFSPIRWIFKNYYLDFKIDYKELKPREFFIRNPGVQASNMCFRVDILKVIGGFDENLSSTTDRDLMIRFLTYCIENNINTDNIKIIDYLGVYYNATNNNSVTKDLNKKHRGLDNFYKKYISIFFKKDLAISLKRAKRLFKYEKTIDYFNNLP